LIAYTICFILKKILFRFFDNAFTYFYKYSLPSTGDPYFIPIIIWRKQVENCAKYLDKCRLVSVEGRIQVRTYEKEGRTRWMTEVVAKRRSF
jgi:single-strand DNA-binding protein